MRRIERVNTGDIKVGQDLVVAGFAGLAGTILTVEHKKTELLSWFTQDYLEHILEKKGRLSEEKMKQWKIFGATECEPAGEGGILTALWNLSGAYETGIEFSLRLIPVKQETIEICERYDVNPYRLFSENCFLLTADNGGDLIRALEKEDIHGAVIGKVTSGIGRIIDHGESKGFLDRPTKDEIHKILK